MWAKLTPKMFTNVYILAFPLPLLAKASKGLASCENGSNWTALSASNKPPAILSVPDIFFILIPSLGKGFFCFIPHRVKENYIQGLVK